MEQHIPLTSTDSSEIIVVLGEDGASCTDSPTTTDSDTEIIEYTIKEIESDEQYRTASAIEANEYQAQ